MWAGGMAEEVKCVTSKCEPLSSNPRTAKNKTKQKLMFILGENFKG
jgi:hypothetical protein